MKYFFALMILLGMSIPAFSQGEQQPQPNENGVYDNVEQMPLYRADCPENELAKQCADLAMLQYVYDNVKYPVEAQKQEVEGMAVVTFIVELDGTISNPSIDRNPGYGMGEEVLRIVNTMNDNGPSWIPGMQDGKPVRVEFKLPVKFSLTK